jgi:hypothetical protein
MTKAKPKANDGGVIKERILTYRALPYPLPEKWKATLIHLGKIAVKARKERIRKGTEDSLEVFPETQNLLDFEEQLRFEIGLKHIRMVL